MPYGISVFKHCKVSSYACKPGVPLRTQYASTCVPPTDVMYCSMNLARLVKQVLQLLYGNCSRKHDLRIEVHHRNQPNKTKQMLYKPLVHLKVALKSSSLYDEHFS